MPDEKLPRWEPLNPDQFELIMPTANGKAVNTGLIVSRVYLDKVDQLAHNTIRDHFRHICHERGWDSAADVPELPKRD